MSLNGDGWSKCLWLRKRERVNANMFPVECNGLVDFPKCITAFYITDKPGILPLRPPGWRYGGREHSSGVLPPGGPLGPAHRIESLMHVGPLKEKRRLNGTDFLCWRSSEMRNSANPASCAPGSRGPPAYCESLHSASFCRTLQLILGQKMNFCLHTLSQLLDFIVSFTSFSQFTHA